MTIRFDDPEYSDQRFENLDGREVIVEGREFHACVFFAVQLSAAKFLRCKFIDCKFGACDLSNMSFKGCSLRDVSFEDSKLIGINWTEAAVISHPKFHRCVLNYGNFIGLDLRKSELCDCVAREIELAHTNLSDANCRNTDFSGTRFLQTNLSRADLRGACNYAINPGDNILKKARFSLPEATSLLFGLDILLDE